MINFYRFLLILAISLVCNNLFAQTGTPLITNFSFGESSIDNESWAVAQDKNGQMLFANRRGIITFDGIQWNAISTPSVPLSLYHDPLSSKIYVGCKNNIGYLQKTKNGKYVYKSIKSAIKDYGDVTQISSIENDIYFYSSHCVTKYSTKNLECSFWKAALGEPFQGIIINNNNVYVNVSKLGLHQLKNNLIVPIKNGFKLIDHNILFYFRYSRAQTLIGTSKDSLYLFNGNQIDPYLFDSYDYIHENILTGGIDVDAENFVLSTVTGGCLVIDKKSSKSIYTLNYQTGLPDDEVYSLGIDRNKGLWLLHEFGMTRVDLKLPIRNFNCYPGLEGNLTSLIEHDSTLFISTSEGVFYLNEVKNYNEIEVLIKVNDEKKEKERSSSLIKGLTNDSQEIENSKNNKEETKEKKGSFLGKLFGKKKKKGKDKKGKSDENESEETNDEEVANEEIIETEELEKSLPEKTSKRVAPKKTSSNSEYEKQKIYALQSITHRFKKIDKIDGKVKQFEPFDNKLLIACNTGLYQIENYKASVIIPNTYINHIHRAKSNHNKFYIGTNQGIYIIKYNNGKWDVLDHFRDFKENVYSILELNKNNIWVGSENIAYNIVIDNSEYPVNIKSYKIKSDFTERILVRNVYGIPYFFLSTGLYSYNQEKDSVLYNTKTNKGFTGQSKYIFTQNDITWVFNELKWISLHESAKFNNLPEEFLEIFDNISNIFVSSNSNLWLIDNNNTIYNVINGKKDYEEIFDVFLQFINGSNGNLLPLTNLQLDYENNAINFHISAPYFVKPNAISFQYKIEGLTENWSDWRQDISIDLPYLPNGKYQLQIKAKNILGKQTKVKTFNFKVLPPFWKRWWFYILCIATLILLFWVLIHFREKQLKRTQKILEDKVAIRTEQLEKEKIKTEELLLNILPNETAEELKTFGKAQARQYKFASVMFTDFKGFTFLAEKLTSKDLVKEIDYCFSHFDDIIEKYNIEKIKTIGDAYMCASGIPKENSNNPILLVLAGLEIIDFMNKHKEERAKDNLPFFEIRIGIHTGSLVTGVVGKKKFAYDIWGDTVNTAARLESSGEAGMLNISETTYNVVKDFFECEFRGKIKAKNKGEIAMYFVSKIKKEFSTDNGKNPSTDFIKKLKQNGL